MIALSGVRNSWLMLARNADLVREAASASARLFRPARWRRGFRGHFRGTPPARGSCRRARPAPAAGIGADSSPRAIASMLPDSSVSRARHVAQHELPDDEARDHEAGDRNQNQPAPARLHRLPRQRRRRVGFALGRLDQIGHVRAQVPADRAQVQLMVAERAPLRKIKPLQGGDAIVAARQSDQGIDSMRSWARCPESRSPSFSMVSRLSRRYLMLMLSWSRRFKITDASCALTTRASNPVIWLMSARML